MKLIGLAGQKQHGKSTVANVLRTKYANVCPYAFAQPIKEICKVLFGGCDQHWYGCMKEVKLPIWEMTPRELMMDVGTRLFRNNFDREMWIKVAKVHLERVKSFHANMDDGDASCEPVVVIDDVRFENEARMILDAGGRIYRIVNDNIPIIYTGTHESEQWLDSCFFAAELHAANLAEAEENAHFIARENRLCLITTP